MGARTAVARAFALHDSNRRHVPLEFSLAAIFSSRPRNLRGGGLATALPSTTEPCNCAWTDRRDRNRSRDLSHGRHLCVSANVDPYRAGGGLVLFEFPLRDSEFRSWAPWRSRFARCSPRICASRQTAEFRDIIFLKNS